MKKMNLGEKLNSKALSNDRKPTLGNDLVFADVMKDTDILTPFLEEIIGEAITSIHNVQEQDTMYSVSNGEVSYERMDVVVTTPTQVIDIEIQRKSSGEKLSMRARLYSSMLDTSYENHRTGTEKYNLRSSYVIFLVPSWPKPYADYTMRDMYGDELGDKRHIVFANYAKWRELHQHHLATICAMIQGENPGTDYAHQISTRIDTLCSNQEWRLKAMSFEERLQEEREYAHAEGRTEERLLIAENLYRNLVVSGCNSEQSFAQLRKLIPTLTDADVAALRNRV